MSARRWRVWAVVLVLHLLLAAWLVTVTGRTADETPPRRLDAVLIQQVAVAPPAAQSRTVAVVRPETPLRVAPPPVVTPPVVPPAQARQAKPPVQDKPVPALPSPVQNRPRDATRPAPAPLPQAVTTAPAQPALADPPPSSPSTAAAATAPAPAVQPPAAVAGTTVSNSAVAATAATASSASAAIATYASAARASESPDIVVTCPGQVAPVMPRLAIRAGLTGEVVAQALIVGGRVTEVRILSGPPVFHNAVRDAMRQYRCASSSTQVRVTQKFSFRLE